MTHYSLDDQADTEDILIQFRRVVFSARQRLTPGQLSVLAQGLWVIAESLLYRVDLPEPEPTPCKPGSEKVEVLAERVSRGERLWSERDNFYSISPDCDEDDFDEGWDVIVPGRL